MVADLVQVLVVVSVPILVGLLLVALARQERE